MRFGKTRTAAEQWVETVDEPNAALVASTRDAAERHGAAQPWWALVAWWWERH